MKKLIIIDYDNTLVDFMRNLLDRFNEHHQISITLNDINEYNFEHCSFDENGINGIFLNEFFLANISESYLDLVAYPDSKEFLKNAQSNGYRIEVVTARNSEHSKETTDCLKANELGPYLDEIVYTHNKAEYIKSIKDEYSEIIFIDDKKEEIERSQNMNPEVIHYTREMPYNQGSVNMIKSLLEIELSINKKKAAYLKYKSSKLYIS